MILAISLGNTPISRQIVGPTEVGTLGLEMKFSMALEQNTDIYCIGVFADTLTLEPISRLLTMTWSNQSFG